jgi:predicted nuclease of restriction endonuclease-like (RecB) superfamily
VDKVAADLRTAFPAMKGFSRANLMYIRGFVEAWPEAAFVQQPVGQLPWVHNLVLLTKLKARDACLAYAAAAMEHGWSRAVQACRNETRTVDRQGSL